MSPVFDMCMVVGCEAQCKQDLMDQCFVGDAFDGLAMRRDPARVQLLVPSVGIDESR